MPGPKLLRGIRPRRPSPAAGRPPAVWVLAAVVLAVLGRAAGAEDGGGGEAAAAADPPASPTFPDEPGVHHLGFRYALNGETRRMTFGVYLPERIKHLSEAADAEIPMLVFLSGVGERGQAEKDLYANGPLASMKRIEGLADHLDFIILAPQCPRDQRWKSEGMPRFVVDLVDMAREQLPVDADRVYLTGLSMGGTGTWHVARSSPQTFAAIAPICGRPVEPDRTAEALAKLPTWIIVGGSDKAAFTRGARAMHDAMKQVDAHVRLTVVPGVGHGVWPHYYRKPAFYQWLLQHERGGRIHDLHTDDRLLRIAFAPAPDPAWEAFERKLAKQFERFAPYWHLDGCGRGGKVGLHETLAGRDNVFVTVPLHRQVPCRLMFTAELSSTRAHKLRIVVGHAPQGRWRLSVNLGRDRVLRKVIDGETTGDGWVELTLDLSRYAGQKLPIQLLHETVDGEQAPLAYWDVVEVVSEAREDK